MKMKSLIGLSLALFAYGRAVAQNVITNAMNALAPPISPQLAFAGATGALDPNYMAAKKELGVAWHEATAAWRKSDNHGVQAKGKDDGSGLTRYIGRAGWQQGTSALRTQPAKKATDMATPGMNSSG